MTKIDQSSWPVLFISDQLLQKNATSAWLQDIIQYLTTEQDLTVLRSFSLADAAAIVLSREDLGVIVLDWDMQEMGHNANKNAKWVTRAQAKNIATGLVELIRERHATLPILLLTGRDAMAHLPDAILASIHGLIWKLTETPPFLAGRIEQMVVDYAEQTLPIFFKSLVNYVNHYKYAWHTPGHMGGEGFLCSPSGAAFHRFFGENCFRSDLSISVPELGSLLDHSGVTGEAETFSAEVFGADQTYYVLNGTSTANQIIWRSQVCAGEPVLVDRNCHKSLAYANIITGAHPSYILPLRNGLGIIGPLNLVAVDTQKPYKILTLTNSTYDGICYDTHYIQKQFTNVAIFHFDEAWYAYAKFHPFYAHHFGTSLQNAEQLIFCTQSTHKLLTAFSQASMLHIKFPASTKALAHYEEDFHDTFNESYMMHTSTSPQYAMIASLEIASKMMHDNGHIAWEDTLREAIELRREIASIQKRHEDRGDWFFGLWQPPVVGDLQVSIADLIAQPDLWKIKPGEPWHGFAVHDTYALLDPIKLTFLCPGLSVNGQGSDFGIPAAVVSRYLMRQGIVCEKTDYYSWLLLNSLGTTRGKQGTLLAELFEFKTLFDRGATMDVVFPELVAHYPQYRKTTLQAHCRAMHQHLQSHRLVEKMNNAFQHPPEQAMLPSEAYRQMVKKNVAFRSIQAIASAETPVLAATMIAPYPPGIPLLMGGEVFNGQSKAIVEYLLLREAFEKAFPGYEGDNHGIERRPLSEGGEKGFFALTLLEGQPSSTT